MFPSLYKHWTWIFYLLIVLNWTGLSIESSNQTSEVNDGIATARIGLADNDQEASEMRTSEIKEEYLKVMLIFVTLCFINGQLLQC